MRICILNNNFYRGSGITVAIERLTRTEHFQQIDVFLAGCETIDGRQSTDETISMVAADRYRTFALMNSGFGLLQALLHFCQWVRTRKIDVIHVHHRRLAAVANFLVPFTGVPVLFTGHLTFAEAAWFRWGAPPVMTGVSPSVVAYLRQCTNAKKVALIYNPVSFPGVVRSPADSGARVVSVGRLDPVKGYDILIDAWARLHRAGAVATLDIFGEGSMRNSLEQQIGQLGLQKVVTLRGFSPDLVQHLPHYRFNVLVSQKEGFPNGVVEAAAHSLPSLLTNVDGSRDALPPDLELPNGIPFGDAERLAETLLEWLAAPAKMIRDGERFRHFLKERCDPETVAAQYLSLYRDLSRKQPRAHRHPSLQQTELTSREVTPM